MPIIQIDNVEYDSEQLSDNAKEQLTSLQFVDGEIARMQAQLAVLQTARNSYFRALKEDVTAGSGENIKFS